MKQLMRRLSRVADSSSNAYGRLRSRSMSSAASSGRSGKHPFRRSVSSVPSGHFPVYVGEEMERFVVNADLLNHPIFVQLLNRSAQEYGYEQKGVLRIPCRVAVFEQVLDALRLGADVSDHIHDLINSAWPSSSDDELLFSL